MKETPQTKTPRVAFILSGCGSKDGSEITEAVTLLVTMDARKWHVECFAPDILTHHVVDHLTNEVCAGKGRSVLVEAARIARGAIKPLIDLDLDHFDAVLFPGGFGVAKNFCNVAFSTDHPTLQGDIYQLLQKAIQLKKVLGALCIAPILLALAARDFGLNDMHITLGASPGHFAQLLKTCGVTHVSCEVHEACLDKKNRMVSSPAYMHAESTPSQIMASAQALIEHMSYLL